MKSSTISNPFLNATSDETQVTQRAALVERIMPAPVYRGTYNSVVAAAIAVLTVPALIVVDTGKRTVTIAVSTSAIYGEVSSAASALSGSITRYIVPSDPDSRSAGIIMKEGSTNDVVTSGVSTPVGQTALDAAFDLSLGAQDTQKSIGSLVDALADAMESQTKEGVIIIDQRAEELYIYIANSTSAFNARTLIDGELAGATLAEFEVAVPDAGPTAPGFFGQ